MSIGTPLRIVTCSTLAPLTMSGCGRVATIVSDFFVWGDPVFRAVMPILVRLAHDASPASVQHVCSYQGLDAITSDKATAPVIGWPL